MVATVLIGKESEGAGVTARIFNLGDEASAEAGLEFSASEVRHGVASGWALLSTPVIPTGAGEMVFKLSRHSLMSGQRWTWLGCYKQAEFYDAQRAGTYIGSGVLSLDTKFDARGALRYILDVLQQLATDTISGGKVFRSVHEVRERAVDIQSEGLQDICERPSASGLAARGPERLYIDLSTLNEKAEFDDSLVDFLNRAQEEAGFEPFHQMVIGNAGRMGKAARSSQAYRVYSPNQWHAGPGSAPTTSIMAAKSSEAEKEVPPVSAIPIASRPNQASPDAAILSLVRADIRRLEDKLDNIDKVIVPSNVPTNPSYGRPEDLFDRGVHIVIVVFGIGVVAALIGLFYWWSAYTEVPSVTDTPQSSAVAENPSIHGDDCQPIIVPEEAVDEDIRRALEEEKRCLQQEVRSREQRVIQIDSALTPTAEPE